MLSEKDSMFPYHALILTFPAFTDLSARPRNMKLFRNCKQKPKYMYSNCFTQKTET